MFVIRCMDMKKQADTCFVKSLMLPCKEEDLLVGFSLTSAEEADHYQTQNEAQLALTRLSHFTDRLLVIVEVSR
jgi:hypothetical protein